MAIFELSNISKNFGAIQAVNDVSLSFEPGEVIGLMGDTARVRAIPLIAPVVEHSVGLVAHARDPLPKVVKAMLDLADDYRLPDLRG